MSAVTRSRANLPPAFAKGAVRARVTPARVVLALAAAAMAAVAIAPRARAAGPRGPAMGTAQTDSAAAAHADSVKAAPTDSTLDQYLGGLRDSTDVFFGRVATPLDTTGLDSAGVANFSRSHPKGRLGPVKPDFGVSFRFNRVDGPVYGGGLTLTSADRLGQVTGRALYAVGPNQWQWTVNWSRRWGGFERGTSLEVTGGSETSTMDRLLPVSVGDPLATLGALVRGYDSRFFLRRDGWAAALTYERSAWHGTLGWRDAIEIAQATTTSWNFVSRPLDPFENLAASHGRAREAMAALGGTLGRLPLQFEGSYRASSPQLGSDFDYRLARIALGADLSLGRTSALVPQAVFAQVNGDALPQESFYLGGVSTLTTLRTARLAGSSAVLARLDWIGTRDLLALAHIPHPAYLPLQGDLFVSSGAISGSDPFGGPERAGDVWSNRGAWHSEGGIALVWQPGLPDPTSVARLAVAWPMGPSDHQARVTLTFSNILFMLAPTRP